MFNAIDVSKWQGSVNWATVKNSGVTHAMIRAGYGNSVKQIDPQFKRNAANCELHGIDYGVYWYSYATSPNQARQEARCCLQVIKGLNLTMPVAYDIEYEPGILALDNSTRTAMVKAFLDEVESAGYYGILYASTDFIRNRLNWRDLSKYDVWAAQYGSACTCPLPYGIWQYSSSNPLGIPGYGNSLDCNRVYKDYPSIIKGAGLNGFTVPDINPEPDLSVKLQKITVGPLSNSAAISFWNKAKELKIGYESQYTGMDKTRQILTIGPASSGDAMQVWKMAQSAGVAYKSEYVE